MNKNAPITVDPQVFAVLHAASEARHCLVVSTASGFPSVLASRSFTAYESSRIDPWLDEHRVSRVIAVLPASSVICRTLTLPDADEEQLHQALHLQAEALLLGIAPPHRLGMAVLPATSGETARVGMVLAWPESSLVEPPPTARPVTYAPDTAALAALINGHRPDEPLLWFDPHSESLSLALSHANGVVFRAIREGGIPGGGLEADTAAEVGRNIAETALGVGHTASFVENMVASVKSRLAENSDNGSSFLLPDAVRQDAVRRLKNASSDESWWSTFGLAAGVALSIQGPLSPLTELLESAPDIKPPLWSRLAERLSHPRAAVAMVLLAALVLILGPFVQQRARLSILNLRHPELHEQHTQAILVRKQYEMYEQLEEDAWPIAKLLSDIASNTPRGIELNAIRILSRAGTFTLSGTALPQSNGEVDAREVITEFRKNLVSSGLFESPNERTGDRDNMTGKYNFEMSGHIRHPYRRFPYDPKRDFSAVTMQQRIDGMSWKDGSETPEAVIDSSPEQIAKADSPIDPTKPSAVIFETKPGRSPDDIRGNSFGSGAITPSGPGEPEVGRPGVADDRGSHAVAIPDPISPGQIKAMSKAEAQNMLQTVAKARRRGHLSEEIDARLQTEFNLLVAHIRELASGASKKSDTEEGTR